MSNTSSTQVWAGPLAGDAAVVVLLNAGETATEVTATWEMLKAALPSCSSLVATDLWTEATANFSTGGPAPAAMLQPHASAALRLACQSTLQ